MFSLKFYCYNSINIGSVCPLFFVIVCKKHVFVVKNVAQKEIESHTVIYEGNFIFNMNFKL